MPEQDSHADWVKKLLAQDSEIKDAQTQEFRVQLEQSLESWEEKTKQARRRVYIALAVYLAGDPGGGHYERLAHCDLSAQVLAPAQPRPIRFANGDDVGTPAAGQAIARGSVEARQIGLVRADSPLRHLSQITLAAIVNRWQIFFRR